MLALIILAETLGLCLTILWIARAGKEPPCHKRWELEQHRKTMGRE